MGSQLHPAMLAAAEPMWCSDRQPADNSANWDACAGELALVSAAGRLRRRLARLSVSSGTQRYALFFGRRTESRGEREAARPYGVAVGLGVGDSVGTGTVNTDGHRAAATGYPTNAITSSRVCAITSGITRPQRR